MTQDLLKAERKKQLKVAAELVYEAHRRMESAITWIPTSELRNSAADINILLIDLYAEMSKTVRNFYLEREDGTRN